MYVCICNALTENHVKQVANDVNGCVPSVYECFGVQPSCGKCASSLRGILRQSAAAKTVAAE